jgi:hypothetical protein
MATFVTKHLRIAGGGAEMEQRLRPTGWFSERTAWVGRLTPLRRFVRTETGGAALLIAAVLAALVWANVGSSYQEVWETHLDVTVGADGIRLPLREWVNSGLMTFFFLVVGLEARRELDLESCASAGVWCSHCSRPSAGWRRPPRSTSPSTWGSRPPPAGGS